MRISYHLGRLLPEGAFLRKLSLLASGTIVGQALIVLSSPFLTRLYTPEEFGFFAVFAALAAMLAVIVSLRYEYAVAMVDDEDEAAGLVVVSAVASALIAVLLALLIWWRGDRLAVLVDTPKLVFWLWLLPPAVLLWGIGSGLTFWSVRQRTYRVNALNRTLQLGSQAGGQLGFGLAGSMTPFSGLGAGGAGGLILGYVLGYVVRLGHFLRRLPAADLARMRAVRPTRLWRLALVHWRYAAFGSATALLQSACQQAPAILIAILYSPTLAGFYALSQRIMGLPVKMLSEAASKVFIGEIRDVAGPELHRYVLRTAALFAGLGLLGAVPLLVAAPSLFALVFGEVWRDAGLMVQLLIPLYLARFVVQPVSMVLYYLEQQEIHLLLAALNGLALLVSFGSAYLFALEASHTILMFSLASGSSFLLTLWLSWRLARRVGASPRVGA